MYSIYLRLNNVFLSHKCSASATKNFHFFQYKKSVLLPVCAFCSLIFLKSSILVTHKLSFVLHTKFATICTLFAVIILGNPFVIRRFNPKIVDHIIN